jgi:hypothetical protein
MPISSVSALNLLPAFAGRQAKKERPIDWILTDKNLDDSPLDNSQLKIYKQQLLDT